MKPRSLFTLAAASTVLLMAAAQAGIAGTGVESAASPAASRESRQKTGQPVLERGMTAETILHLVGKPAEISPLASPEGKAEKWTYRRQVEVRNVLDSTTVKTIPVFVRPSGDGGIMGTALQPVYHMRHITICQVTTLLLYEGKLVVAKQWRELSQTYDG